MIIIPAHNEAASIGRLLRELKRLHLPWEVVVVDNNSHDQTSLFANKYGATVLRETRAGYSAALLCGYRYAVQQSANLVVQMDADGQHSPWEIRQLVGRLDSADWVIGSRHKTGTAGTLFRRAGSGFVGQMARWCGVGALYDLSSGFWAFNRSVLSFFVNNFPETVDANLRLRATQYGFRLVETSVEMHERKTGQSMHEGLTGLYSGFVSTMALLRDYSSQAPSSARTNDTSLSDI